MTEKRLPAVQLPTKSLDEAVKILRQHRAYYAGRIEQYDQALKAFEELEDPTGSTMGGNGG